MSQKMEDDMTNENRPILKVNTPDRQLSLSKKDSPRKLKKNLHNSGSYQKRNVNI